MIIILAVIASALVIADGWLYSRINRKQAELKSLQQREDKLQIQLNKVKKRGEQVTLLKELWPRMANSSLTPDKWDNYKVEVEKKIPCRKITHLLSSLQPEKRYAQNETRYWLVPKILQVKRLDSQNHNVNLEGRLHLYTPRLNRKLPENR